MVFNVVPTADIATTAMTAMSAARSPYSMRSWPSHREPNSAMNPQIRFMPSSLRSPNCVPPLRSGVLELRRDRGKDGVDRAARVREREHGNQRDQTDEQRVLDQVLRIVLLHERNQSSNQRIHGSSPCACSHAPSAVCP